MDSESEKDLAGVVEHDYGITYDDDFEPFLSLSKAGRKHGKDYFTIEERYVDGRLLVSISKGSVALYVSFISAIATGVSVSGGMTKLSVALTMLIFIYFSFIFSIARQLIKGHRYLP